MTDQEIINLMKLPIRGIYADQYKLIYQQITGSGFPGCLCGSGLTRLHKWCFNYARQIEINQASTIVGDQTEL